MAKPPSDPTAPLAALLRAWYGFQDVRIDPTPRGYSNRSHFVLCDGKHLVLRISFPGKPAAQVAREERLLAFLRSRRGPRQPDTPQVVPTLGGRPHFLSGGRRHHLFFRLPGQVRYRWKDLPTAEDMGAAARALAELHAALRPLEAAAPDPLRSLGQQLKQALRRPLATAEHPLWAEALPLLPAFLRGTQAALAAARALPLGRMTPSWVQGDFQLENLLFSGREVTGIVDFDDARPSLRELDLHLALLSLARDGHRDDRFRYDAALLRAGLCAYRAAAARRRLPLHEEAMDQRHLPLYERLFCLQQCLLHLRAARRGQWRLTRGIGFWACYRALAGPP